MHLTVRLRVSIIRVYLRIDIDILVNRDLVRDMNDRLAIIIWHNYGCFGTLEIEKESYSITITNRAITVFGIILITALSLNSEILVLYI